MWRLHGGWIATHDAKYLSQKIGFLRKSYFYLLGYTFLRQGWTNANEIFMVFNMNPHEPTGISAMSCSKETRKNRYILLISPYMKNLLLLSTFLRFYSKQKLIKIGLLSVLSVRTSVRLSLCLYVTPIISEMVTPIDAKFGRKVRPVDPIACSE